MTPEQPNAHTSLDLCTTRFWATLTPPRTISWVEHTAAEQSSQAWDLKAGGKSSLCNNSTKKSLSFHLQLQHEVIFHSGLQLLTNKTDICEAVRHQPQGAFNAQRCSRVTQHKQTRFAEPPVAQILHSVLAHLCDRAAGSPDVCRGLLIVVWPGLPDLDGSFWMCHHRPKPVHQRRANAGRAHIDSNVVLHCTLLLTRHLWLNLLRKKKQKGLKADKTTDGKSAKSCCLPSSQTSHLWCDAGNYKVTTWKSGTRYPEGKKE